MRTRKFILTLTQIIIFLMTLAVAAQDKARTPFPYHRKMSTGLSFGHYGYDPGFAFEVTTRPFLHGNLSGRFRGIALLLEPYKSSRNHWASYQSFGASLVYNVPVGDRTRFFAELGLMTIVPDIRFSSKKFQQGVFQYNGIEIALLERTHSSFSLVIGAGPAFVQAYADKLEGHPRYGNGIVYFTGIRWYR